MTLVEVVMAYREQYRIERGFGRFKGRPLLLTPLFLQTESRVEGLIHWLSLALWVLVMVEFLIRRPLANTHSEVAGLYRWPATRTTASPTAELIWRAFRGLSLSVVEMAGQRCELLSPLSDPHHRLLEWLGLSSDIYERLIPHFQKPALNLSEL